MGSKMVKLPLRVTFLYGCSCTSFSIARRCLSARSAMDRAIASWLCIYDTFIGDVAPDSP